MLPFWVSIGVLSATQGAIVALPSAKAIADLRRLLLRGRLRSGWWAALPAGSIVAFVIAGIAASSASATALTYFALVAVPLGAAIALGWLACGARPLLAIVTLPIFALAWVARGDLAGEAAAVALSALSCVALGALLASATPPRWLALGIVAMAIVDATLVAVNLLQQPNAELNAAHPAAGLPRLQAALFGSAAMGYGDLFVAALLGGLLAATGSRVRQRRVALLVAAIAIAFDLLFFLVRELPATVPVAISLLVVLALERRARLPLRSKEQRGVTGGSAVG